MTHKRPRLLRITTVPLSLQVLLEGQLSFFKEQGFDVLAVSSDGPEAFTIKQAGFDHWVVPMTRKVTPLTDLWCVIKLSQIIRKFRPDIIHTHTPKAGLLGMLAGWIWNVPIRLHTVAGLPLMESRGFKRKLLILSERITYACATEVYSNSFGLREYIHRHIGSSHHVRVLGKGSTNGIDTGYFSRTPALEAEAEEIRERFSVPSNAIVFSFAGRIVKDKGIGELIQAFKQIRAYHDTEKKYFLMLIGAFEQELNPLTTDDYNFIKADSGVILPGFQGDIRPWIIASDIFVFPSYREGFPNVVMQASCLGVPCIVSDINGSNEIIDDQRSGLVVQPKDDQALFEAMADLAANPVMRKTFAEEARHFVVKNFERKFIWETLLQEYNRLLKREV